MEYLHIINIVKSQISEGHAREKMCYFIEYYCLSCKWMEKGTLEVYPYSVHVILHMLEDELKNYPNSRNLIFFREMIAQVKGKDCICRQEYGYLLDQLQQHVVSDPNYSLQICRELLDKMNEGKYARRICERLETILFDGKNLEKQKNELRYLTIVLIIEQKLYGYSIKSIQKLPDKLFQGWRSVQEIIYTNYPFVPEFQGENKSLQIKEYMENLKVRDRIHDLQKVFERKSEKYVFVCGISGMKGQMLDLEIGNVKIYHAGFAPKFDFEKEEDDFIVEKIESPIHAAVELVSLEQENFMEEAKREVEKALDIICCYSSIQVPIHIDMSAYVVLDKELMTYSSGGGIDELAFRNLRGLDYDRDNWQELQDLYQKYAGAVLEKEDEVSPAIQNSARWFRKGEESAREEDKLLNYWIALESLFPDELALPKEMLMQPVEKTKFNEIQSLVPMLLLRNRLFQYFWEAFYFCNNMYLNYRRTKEDNPFPIPEELAEKCGFKAEGRMYLLTFLESLEEIISEMPDGAAKDYLIQVQVYTTEKAQLKKLIAQITDKMRAELLMGYRFRNIIVHNAKSNMGFIEFFEKQLRNLSGDVIRLIIYLHEQYQKRSLSEFMVRRAIESREMTEKLKYQNLLEWMKENG